MDPRSLLVHSVTLSTGTSLGAVTRQAENFDRLTRSKNEYSLLNQRQESNIQEQWSQAGKQTLLLQTPPPLMHFIRIGFNIVVSQSWQIASVWEESEGGLFVCLPLTIILGCLVPFFNSIKDICF